MRDWMVLAVAWLPVILVAILFGLSGVFTNED
jgi:hypothetical protein